MSQVYFKLRFCLVSLILTLLCTGCGFFNPPRKTIYVGEASQLPYKGIDIASVPSFTETQRDSLSGIIEKAYQASHKGGAERILFRKYFFGYDSEGNLFAVLQYVKKKAYFYLDQMDYDFDSQYKQFDKPEVLVDYQYDFATATFKRL